MGLQKVDARQLSSSSKTFGMQNIFSDLQKREYAKPILPKIRLD